SLPARWGWVGYAEQPAGERDTIGPIGVGKRAAVSDAVSARFKAWLAALQKREWVVYSKRLLLRPLSAKGSAVGGSSAWVGRPPPRLRRNAAIFPCHQRVTPLLCSVIARFFRSICVGATH